MKLLPHLNPSLKAIYAAALLRSAGVGLTGVLLGVYLSRSGFSGAQMGLVITAGLAALALGTLVVSLCADQLGRRRTLVTISLLGAIGGFGFGLANQFWAIMVLAFLGLVNGMGTDRGPAFALEQAVIPQTVPHELRTQALSWHSLLMDIGHALGALLAGVPLLLSVRFGLALSLSYKLTFCIYAVVNLLSVMVYSLPSVLIEAEPQKNTKNEITRLSPQSRVVVAKLAALSGLDSFGGGFLTDALIAYWFFRRFGISEASLGLLFFAGNILNAGSYLVAAALARKIGLLKTMVFTHIPSSILLMLVPLAPGAKWAMGLYLAWESLVEMDVPARQSYLMAVVRPEERTFSSGVTNLARSAARSVSPSLAGYAMQHLALATPLFLGGSFKIVYDLLLYSAFRRLKPPEEQAANSVIEVREQSG